MCCWHKYELVTQLTFPSKNPFFVIKFEFSMTKKLLEIQYFPHFRSKNCPPTIKFVKSYSLKDFSNNTKILNYSPIIFEFWIKWIFNEKICWIFNNFSTISRNTIKPTRCTRTHQGLSNSIKRATRVAMIWVISTWQKN